MGNPRIQAGLFAAVLVAAAIEAADLSLFAGLFRVLEEDLDTGPNFLSGIILLEKVVAAATIPIWGSISYECRPIAVLSLCSSAWGVCTLFFAVSQSGAWLALARMCLSLFVAGLGPIVQVLVAESLPPDHRGKAFGAVIVAFQTGAMVGSASATVFQHSIGPFGIAGWRVTLVIFGICCLAYGAALLPFLGMFPAPKAKQLDNTNAVSNCAASLQETCKSYTVWAVTLQGMFRNSSVQSLLYISLWLQYLGFDDVTAAKIANTRIMGMIVGSVVAGVLSDRISRIFPNKGRIMFGIFGDCGRIFFSFMLFGFCAKVGEPSIFWLGVSMAFLGLFQPFAYTGCTRPILSEVVSAKSRGSAMGYTHMLDNTVAGVVSGPILAWAFNAHGYTHTTQRIQNMPKAIQQQNAVALSESLLFIEMVCQVLMLISLSTLFFTYERDRDMLANSGVGCGGQDAYKPVASSNCVDSTPRPSTIGVKDVI